jgi:hypothetical protein
VQGVYSQLVQSAWGSAYGYLTGHLPPSPVTALGLTTVWTTEALALLGVLASLRLRRPRQLPAVQWLLGDDRSRDQLAHVLTVAMVAYTIFAGAGPEAAAGARFRVPIQPIWYVYAAIGLAVLVRRARQLMADHRGRGPRSRDLTDDDVIVLEDDVVLTR